MNEWGVFSIIVLYEEEKCKEYFVDGYYINGDINRGVTGCNL